MSALVLAPLLVAFGTGILTLLLRFDSRVQRGVSLLGSVGYLAVVALLFDRVVLGPGGPAIVPYYVSNWPAPFGITLVADALSAFMLGLAALVSLPALAFATVYIDEFEHRLSFAPLFHFMLAGVTGSFLTADLFNLFVWFEVMLMASYILVLFYSGPEHTRAALVYVVLNLLASALMLVAIGGLYATVGTLNMADMARRLANPAAYGVELAPTLGLASLLLSVFALKAGLVPFHFWVPSAYRAAPAPVTAVLAGVVKKVGVYAIVRLFFTVFAGAAYAEAGTFAYVGPVLIVAAVASILYGGVAAIGREDVDGLLAFSSVGQVGFIVLPLGVAMMAPDLAVDFGGPGVDGTLATLGIAAALVYAFNHGLAKGLLFLASGTIYSAVGTTDFEDLGGLASRTPLLAASFLLGGLSLVGVPPLIGFFGKLLVFRTSVDGLAGAVPGAGVALAAALAGAVLTIAYVTRIWNAVFWGEQTETVLAALPTRWSRRAEGVAADGGRTDATPVALAVQLTAVIALAGCLVGFGVGVEFVLEAATHAAGAATDTAGYVDAVAPEDVLTGAGGGTGGGGH
ncbi:Na+/H+ antiporter subunit D [Halorarum halophilum]|uniref:Na+/H+ antiporter subunit D n=1 Tax=Halorarum halophilum TaxID=2743090 RepID=A0A7D5GAH6_9EURY|nr:proton-conducting transporter membrane subunit [Halobaculum halophilum]QLG26445.1 Na+/H+ antiporter subunit D [Halobaculum halophilum]